MKQQSTRIDQPWLNFKSYTPSLRVRILNLFRFKIDFLDPIKARKTMNRLGRLAKTKLPDNAKIEEIKFENFNATRIVPEDSNKDKVILYLHGGAYIAGGGDYCRFLGTAIAHYFGWQTLAVDYRLAPENPYPAALEDAFAAYKALLEQGIEPSNIVLFGDSAGGGLCFSLCHKLKDSSIPLPQAIVALSPWTDLSLSGESHQTNLKKDPILLFSKGGPGFHYVPNDQIENPYVSPAFGDFSSFPKIFIVVGENEILLSDSLLIGEKAYTQGVNVQVHLWEWMFHDFPVFHRFPESKKAINDILEYMDKLNK
ncbi:MAG: alpha/beta hydrolase [Syntrophomonadaceae bacterium]